MKKVNVKQGKSKISLKSNKTTGVKVKSVKNNKDKTKKVQMKTESSKKNGNKMTKLKEKKVLSGKSNKKSPVSVVKKNEGDHKEEEDFFHVINSKAGLDSKDNDYVIKQEKDPFLNDEAKEKPDNVSSTKMIKKLEKIKKRKAKSLPAMHPDAEKRTVFVGNVNVQLSRRRLTKFFSKYGVVEAVRLRCIATAKEKGSKKEAVIKKKFHPSRKSMVAYVRFVKEKAKIKALKADGEVLGGLHIRVDESLSSKKSNQNTIFVGNLPWGVNDEELWKMFQECGEVKAVRVIRSRKSSAGKGFGYVSFANKESVNKALEMDSQMLQDRPIRVKKCVKKEKEKKTKPARRKKSGTASLLAPKKVANKTNLHFLKRDKPQHLLEKAKNAKVAKIKPRRSPRNKDPTGAIASGFTGLKVAEGGKKEKRQKLTKGESKKRSIAKQLDKASKK